MAKIANHIDRKDLRTKVQVIPPHLPTDMRRIEIDHGFAFEVAAWARLPAPLQSGIVAMIKAADLAAEGSTGGAEDGVEL